MIDIGFVAKAAEPISFEASHADKASTADPRSDVARHRAIPHEAKFREAAPNRGKFQKGTWRACSLPYGLFTCTRMCLPFSSTLELIITEFRQSDTQV